MNKKKIVMVLTIEHRDNVGTTATAQDLADAFFSACLEEGFRLVEWYLTL